MLIWGRRKLVWRRNRVLDVQPYKDGVVVGPPGVGVAMNNIKKTFLRWRVSPGPAWSGRQSRSRNRAEILLRYDDRWWYVSSAYLARYSPSPNTDNKLRWLKKCNGWQETWFPNASMGRDYYKVAKGLLIFFLPEHSMWGTCRRGRMRSVVWVPSSLLPLDRLGRRQRHQDRSCSHGAVSGSYHAPETKWRVDKMTKFENCMTSRTPSIWQTQSEIESVSL